MVLTYFSCRSLTGNFHRLYFNFWTKYPEKIRQNCSETCKTCFHKSLWQVRKQMIWLGQYPLGLAKFFLENWDKLHGEVWAKSCLETNFQPIRMSFDHPSEASKLAILRLFRLGKIY